MRVRGREKVTEREEKEGERQRDRERSRDWPRNKGKYLGGGKAKATL